MGLWEESRCVVELIQSFDLWRHEIKIVQLLPIVSVPDGFNYRLTCVYHRPWILGQDYVPLR